MIVADSDVLIDFLRGHGEGAAHVARELETRALATTSITAFEIRSGAHSPKHRKAVDSLLEAVTVLPFGAEEAAIAADIRKDLERRGRAIGMADYMIAAICIANEGVLLTRNRKHFERVEALELSEITEQEK
jgi:tRNA(fMet)-specific endonuclease VapC